MKKQQHSNSSPSPIAHPEYVAELERQSKELIEKLQASKLENIKLRLILQENGIVEEGIEPISDVEVICVDQIKRLKEVSNLALLSETEAKILDIMYRNLRLARGLATDKNNGKKAKKATTADLLKIIGN